MSLLALARPTEKWIVKFINLSLYFKYCKVIFDGKEVSLYRADQNKDNKDFPELDCYGIGIYEDEYNYYWILFNTKASYNNFMSKSSSIPDLLGNQNEN